MAQGGAYFIGKAELLGWINSTLALNLSKIEQVDFNAKNEYDFINNYKVLQAAFLKLDVNKPVPVNALVKGRPLDNMEFMQWFKAYADSRGGCAPGYDGPERRAHAKTGDVRSAASGAPRSAAANAAAAGGAGARRASAAAAAAARDPARVLAAKENAAPGGGAAGEPGGKAAPRPRGDAADVGGACAGRLQELQEQVMDLKLKVDGAECERDFYFDKLRDIEILCQTPGLSDIPVVGTIERILYANDEAEAKQAMAEAQARCAAGASEGGVPGGEPLEQAL